ncbi:hypothetical protein OCL06_09405 [Alteromonas sp. ASW11-19]|uniref:Uncharacterized protein n=1 Tax=Alteromonas salexigens TaxID=2982530 RepID=A0ABT2VND3_9ALTE|nr:hypothetical protein [Alteromonas salexigens]MCU7554815.1 hypothetical protein [Alteromonas salexigens]
MGLSKRTVMKKSIIALFATAALTAGVNAQDNANPDNATFGGVNTGLVATGAVVAGTTLAIIANNRGDAKIEPPPPPPPPLGCEGDDPLVDGVCVGTTSTVTNTVTVSGTQTITVPVTVPVTFTYAPQ